MKTVEYLLCCLSEELSEVQQEIGKCLRFTPHHKPDIYDTTNIQRVQLEMADVYTIASMLNCYNVDTGIYIPPFHTMSKMQQERMLDKIKRTNELMEVSAKLGALNDSSN